jgi:hypothetical protein
LQYRKPDPKGFSSVDESKIKDLPPALLLCGGIRDLLKEFSGWRGKRIFFLCRYNAMNAINPINAIDARNSIIAILQA